MSVLVGLLAAVAGACADIDDGLLPPEETVRDSTRDGGQGGVDAGPAAGTDAGGRDAAAPPMAGMGPAATGGSGGADAPPDAGAPDAGGPGAAGCTENPNSLDEVCPLICPEVCNDVDDDCDRRIDESPAELDCDFEQTSTVCDRGQCLIVACLGGYRDCDGDPDNGCEIAPSDPAHCGVCGRVCDLPHASSVCVDGQCQVAECVGDFGDCDGDLTSCETRTTTVGDCGGCGVPCGPLDNAVATCGSGACRPARCVGNFGNCDGDPDNGCELPLNSLSDCGGCGVGCDLGGGTSDCATGVCLSVGCEAGFADCDGDPSDGCEALDSAAHCGRCGARCDDNLPGTASASCATGSCALDCQPGAGDCDGATDNGCETPLGSLQHCTACGDVCELDNAVAECAGGGCDLVRCHDGYGDCDGNPDNGCEQSLNAANHCGSCDTDCSGTGLPECSGGQCSAVDCAPGTADCQAGAPECETDIAGDVDNCGLCGFACAFDPSVDPHAAGGLVCQAGGCVPVCDDDFADCNGDYTDGCETPLTTLGDCGSCGQGCAVANGTATCDSGSCRVDECDPDWDDCDGNQTSCERPLDNTGDCGACGAACDLANAVETCGGAVGSRACAIGVCEASHFQSCDGEDATGCEVDTRSDAGHCGACGNDCLAEPNVATAHCDASACVIDTCDTAFGDCTADPGCETPTDTVDDCGTCGNDCDAALAHTTETACGSTLSCEVVTCEVGFGHCDGDEANGCETDLYTTADCGGCSLLGENEPCENLPNVMQSSCGAGVCTVDVCDEGFEDCNGLAADGCEHEPAVDGRCCDPGADADGDGFDDCADECWLDPETIAPGDCGCPSAPAAGGTLCNDGLCDQNVQCDGAGRCGDPAACAPTGTCSFASYPGMAASGYWFCTDNRSWGAARSACQAIGGDLAHLDDAFEDGFVEATILDHSWLGGRDRGGDDWHWVDDDAPFWSGGPGGSAPGGVFTNWDAGVQPNGTGDCLEYRADGTGWNDQDCATTQDWVCELPADACPDDPKLVPGVCGCAVADSDGDGDGTPDCVDECPADTAFAVAPDCGCPSSPLPGGTLCDDGACAANVQCDGNGTCGALSECITPTRVAAGEDHACALKGDGRVVCWGDAGVGQLGFGAAVDYRLGGSLVKGLTDAVTISVSDGGHHTCAVRATGEVVCWGEGALGRLGDGDTTDHHEPVAVAGIDDALYVSCGLDFSCALLASGEVRCWGEGAAGRLGNGSTADSLTPVAVLAGETGSGNLRGAVHLTSGRHHSCAVLADGHLVCWGENTDGVLGDDSATNRTTPVYVHGVDNAGVCTASDQSGCLSNVTLTASGDNVNLAIHDGGLVSSWGEDTAGENGNPSSEVHYPRRLSGVGGVGTLDDGVWIAQGLDHGCVVRSGGEVACWGSGVAGRLGYGGTSGQPAAVAVDDVDDYVQVDTGNAFSCGKHADGTVSCWGDNPQGQVGDGTGTDRTRPTLVSGSTEAFVEVDTGVRTSCGVTDQGSVYCWGEGNNGELGLGATASHWSPRRVPSIDDASDVAVGEDSVCALRLDGSVSCWGYNAQGQLGDTSVTQRTSPVAVNGLTGAIEIASGLDSFCALKDDGTVWCWGYNAFGQLGNDSVAQSSVPVQVHGVGNVGLLTDAVAIGGGHRHHCAIHGSVGSYTAVCWGLNDLYQLGDGTLTQRHFPVEVGGSQSGFAAGRRVIDGGRFHSCALKANGEAYCWGYGLYGKLGDGATSNNVTAEARVAGGFDDYVRISANSDNLSSTCALRQGGQVQCWGYNDQGEVGDETTTQRNGPVRVHHDEAAIWFGDDGLTSPVVSIGVGQHQVLAVHENGTVSGWGYNGTGQLGTGYITTWILPAALSSHPQ